MDEPDKTVGRRRRSRMDEESGGEAGEERKMSSLRDLPPLSSSIEDQPQQQRRVSRLRSDARKTLPPDHHYQS